MNNLPAVVRLVSMSKLNFQIANVIRLVVKLRMRKSGFTWNRHPIGHP